VSRDCVSGTKI